MDVEQRLQAAGGGGGGPGPDGRVDFQRQELQLDWLSFRKDFKVGARIWGC